MKTIKVLLAVLSFMVLGAIAFLGFAAWSCNSPAVPLDDLNRIQVGMTKAQVQEILGEPKEEIASPDTPGSQWWYKNRFKWYALRIDFTEDGAVIRYIHDD